MSCECRHGENNSGWFEYLGVINVESSVVLLSTYSVLSVEMS